MTFDEKEHLRADLVRAYEAASPDEKAIIQTASVFYHFVDQRRLLDALRACPASIAPGWLTRTRALEVLLKALSARGLLTHHERLGGYRCSGLLVEYATRDAVRKNHFGELARVVRSSREHYSFDTSFEKKMKELRIAAYLGEGRDQLAKILSEIAHFYPDSFFELHPFVAIYNNPFDAETLSSLPPEAQADVLVRIFIHSALKLEPATNAVKFARALLSASQSGNEYLRYGLAQYLILQGKLEEAEQLLSREGGLVGTEAARAWLAFLRAEDDKAIAWYESALSKLRKETNKRKVYFRAVYGAYFALLLLAHKDPVRTRQALEYIGYTERREEYGDIHDILSYLKHYWLVERAGDQVQPMKPELPLDEHRTMKHFFRVFISLSLSPSTVRNAAEGLKAFLNQVKGHGFHLIAAELSELLFRLNGKNEEYGAEAAAFRQASGMRSILDLIAPQEPWERSLDALKNICAMVSPVANEKRLVWLFEYDSKGACRVHPLEQKMSAKGGWSKGRTIAMYDLYRSSEKASYFTEQDKRLAARSAQDNPYWGHYNEFDLAALTELVGHPLVFLKDAPGVRVELVKGEPEVVVSRNTKNIFITLYPLCSPEAKVTVIRETPTRFRLVELTEKYKALSRIIGEGVRVPLSASEKVLEAISSLSSLVHIQSEIGGSMENIKETPSDPTPHVVMMPFQEGLKVQALVRPFSGKGPYYSPGKGGETVIAEIDNERIQTKRSLELERRMVEETLQACTILERHEALDGEWHLGEPEDCLELLTELQGLGDKVCVDWPEGARFKITRQVSFDGFRMAIKRENDWFSLNGEIRLNEDKVMELRQLLELLDATPGRFLPLGNGEFLALTKEFRKRLDDLASLSERHAKGVRFHPLAAPAIEELTAGTDLETDSQWKEQMTRIQSAQALQPVVPSTLQAELRDYQTEGYAWLARLAHWGVGACLADDMGLGKTVQALALIISRAANGPALAVAPTSVCMNWMEEAKRFAPTLNVFQFGAGDRKETLASLRPFDLMVCSYGLLQQEEELLASVEWETIVLDEAQAIKNAATQRSQAAMKLQGRFKIITTGTPVENHLDELWNLFRFINPGLLGSLDAFNRKFANPIERGNDHQARARLKRLIQPFILRRLKTQVLTELPQKTEIILHVELGEEETALYEAMRRQSLDRIARVEGNMGRKSIQILAEIMRLRRLCCNPRLVVPDTKTKSSKFELFVETLEELLDNKHKALIFSQFVGHLGILREFLEERKIPYQYIDGSTPQRERKRSVDAFQSGNGDVFLISLKAGGLGLNLTAADYVLHMDPWWNPAVEDQASDRAYRIGQERPVTIYRLITKGTIEEKIVDLHKHKRALADSLLEGSDMSGRISPDELLQLLVEPADSKK